MNPGDLYFTAHHYDLAVDFLLYMSAGAVAGVFLGFLALVFREANEERDAHVADVIAKVPDGHRSTYVPRLNGAPGYQASCALCPCLNEQPPSLWFRTSEEATDEARDQLIFNENGPRR